MSTKKRFTIAPDLASGIRNTIQSAGVNQGQLHYDLMSIDVIEPDPLNPRRLNMSRQEILHGLDTHDGLYAAKLKDRDALLELSESIKRIGVKNAIEVFKNGLKYQIITGERRYWAALLAGQKTVPVRISQKPDEFNLRYTQWVENINRQDLSLWEKLNNLQLMADAYQQSHQINLNETALQDLLGISAIQAYRYFALLKADHSVIELVQDGKLNNLKLVQELTTMKDKVARAQIISWIAASKDEVTSLARYRAVAGKKPKQIKQKRQPAIRLGSIRHPRIIKQLLNIVLANPLFTKYQTHFISVDWASPTAVNQAFETLCGLIEKEYPLHEIA